MTAVTYSPSLVTNTRRPSLARLATVELRKMADTRAGVWLLATIGLVSAAVVVIMLFVGDSSDLTLSGLFGPTLFPVAVLLPVLGILSVTTEWTQRTALTTFALVPERQRVIAAKLLAGVLLAVLSVGVSLAFAAVGNLIGAAAANGDGSWHLGATALGYGALFQVINMLGGIAIGMLLMSSAFAIVVNFVLPTLWSVLGNMISALKTPAHWLDLSSTTEPLVDNTMHMTGTGWAKLATSVAVWVALPLIAGLIRLLRREVS